MKQQKVKILCGTNARTELISAGGAKHKSLLAEYGIAILVCAAAIALSGCMAAVVAPLASIANGSRENLITVTIDDKTFTPAVRDAWLQAKHLGVVAGDPAAIKAADLFETRGGYTVSVDRTTAKTGEMLGSERREALSRLCSSRHPDLAMLGYTTKTETGHEMIGAIIGRAGVKEYWTMDMLACRTKTALSFGGIMEFDSGVFNQKAQSEYNELVGAEIGGKILAALGK